MKKFQNKYRIESTRLKYWDYSNPGMYFVTICTHNFFEWFGKVVDEEMILNEMGKIAEAEWIKTCELRDNVILNEFVIMPNHVHGIIQLLGDEYTSRDVARNVSTSEHMSNISPKSGSLSTIVHSYKSAVTRSIRKHHHPKFEWQPRFYDHVIRND